MIAFIIAFALTFFSLSAFAEKTELMDVVVKKSTPSEEQSLTPYANVELRHYTNTYYDTDDYLLKQEPSAQVVGQIGLSMYQGYADLYVTFGAIKMAQTQQVLQRRPQAELDLYPIYTENYSLTQYTIIDAPFSDATYDPENAKVSQQGSVITVGLAQALKYKLAGSVANWNFKVGADVWTKMYSRKQPQEIEEEDKQQFLLAKGSEKDATEGEIEAAPFNSEMMMGVGFQPISVSELKINASIHYTQKQEPKYYFDTENEDLAYSYAKEINSHYRLRLSYDLSERVSLINDLYHFHNGFFEGRLTGEDQRRLRNIARIQVQL